MPTKKIKKIRNIGVAVFTYAGANALLDAMETGECNGKCRSEWLRVYKRNLTKMKLPASQQKTLSKRMATILKKKPSKAMTKKYRENPAPPYPANIFCESIETGNDGQLYKSLPDTNNMCSWKRYKSWWNWW